MIKLSESRSADVTRGIKGAAPGGGGTLDIYWWGCAAAHPERRVLGTGTSQKRGVLGTGTTQKRGGLRHGHESKKGGLRHGHESKKG